MRRNPWIPLVLLSMMLPEPSHAQSLGAIAGWISLVTTPVGAFAPSIYIPSTSSGRRWGVQTRYSHWQFAPDDDNTTNLAIGAAVLSEGRRWSFDLGRTTKKECDCDWIMVGTELYAPVAGDGAATLSLNPEVGFVTYAGDESDFSAVAAALNVPLSYAAAVGTNVRVVPFVAPGLGLGRVSGGGDSQYGGRLLLGGGAAVKHVTTGLQLSVGASKIFIDGGAAVYGATVSFGS